MPLASAASGVLLAELGPREVDEHVRRHLGERLGHRSEAVRARRPRGSARRAPTRSRSSDAAMPAVTGVPVRPLAPARMTRVTRPPRAARPRHPRRLEKRSWSGPMPAIEKRSGANSSAAIAVTSSWLTASTRAATSSSERISLPLSTARPSRDMRDEVDSSASSMRPLTLSLARSSSSAVRPPAREVGHLGARDLDALRHVLGARADVDADLAGVVVARRVAVDAVGHAALLADLLHEPRGGRPAEHVVEQREREAAIVVARQPGRRQADVVLLGVAREEELLPAGHGRRRAHGPRRPRRAAGARRRARERRRARRCPRPRRRRCRRRSACRGRPRCRCS